MINEISKAKKILTEPSRFFQDAKKEKTINESMRFLFLFSTIYAVLYFTFRLAMGVPDLTLLPNPFMAWIVASGTIITLLITISVLTIISSAVYHAIALLLKCRKGWKNTLKAIIYGTIPAFVLGWIPFITFAGTLWSIGLTVFGISKLHDISVRRAALIVIPLDIFFLSLTLAYSGNLDMIFGAHSSELLAMFS